MAARRSVVMDAIGHPTPVLWRYTILCTGSGWNGVKLSVILDNNHRNPRTIVAGLMDQACFVQNWSWGDRMTEKNAILVVEDDPLVSEVIAAALDDTYPIVIVETASQAMEMLRGGDIRLMLLDCTLPGGVDADLIPRADQSGTPVVLMSGDPGRVAKLTDQPRPFVLKPFTLTGLLDTVRGILDAPSP